MWRGKWAWPANKDFMLSTVIFDFDMTLVDSLETITNNLNKMAEHFDLPPVTVENVRRVMSFEAKEFWIGLWGRYEKSWGEYFTKHIQVQEKHTLKINPGAEKLLADLKKSGRRLAVASNRNQPWQALAQVNLAHYFDTAVGAADVPKAKPAPDMLITVLKQLGSQAGQSVFIGDAIYDMEAAKAARVQAIGIPQCGVSPAEMMKAGAWQVRPDLESVRDILF